MKTARDPSSQPAPSSSSSRSPLKAGRVATLGERLIESEETLRAIRSGEVDAVLLAGKDGNQVFSLEGVEHAYRVLIESMNEGALTLTTEKVILYANACFARLVKTPLEQVIGSSFRRFISDEDRLGLRTRMKRAAKSGAKIQMLLNASDGSRLPVQISIRLLAAGKGSDQATISMIVTDMTEARRTEELLRALTHRMVQVQEAERGSVALELHDNITQLLCAVLYRSQALADEISPRDKTAKREALKLREMLGHTAKEVERISRNLRPSVLDQLGLVAILGEASAEFTERTGVPVKLRGVKLTARLSADTELALYRIFQEALKNVEAHARARHVTVSLKQEGDVVQLVINDDGVGFVPDRSPAGQNRESGLGLLSMRERAAYVGGTFEIKSVRYLGTDIVVHVPLLRAKTNGK